MGFIGPKVTNFVVNDSNFERRLYYVTVQLNNNTEFVI